MKKRVRVVHVVQHLKKGGAETLVRALCSGLARADVDVHVVSIYDDGLSAQERAALGVPVHEIARRGRADLGFFPRLVAKVRELRPDVVHAHLHAGKYAGRAAAVAAGVPTIVFTEHGEEPGGFVRATADRILRARTARFVVFGEAQRAALARREGVPVERIVVIPNGVAEPPAADRNALRASLGIAPETFAVYLPARLAAQKNQQLAIRAFARRWRDDPTRRLYLAGVGPDELELRALVERLELSSRIEFLGFRDDAATLGRAMDLFLLPSVWERMPLALGEAMLADLAVVSTPWEGSAAFLRDGETAIVSAAHEVDAFAAALRRAANPALRHALAVRARAFAAERFDMAKTVRAHVDLYRSLVGAGT